MSVRSFFPFRPALLLLLFLPLLISSCGNGDFTPKPKGYFRIDLPEKTYQEFNGPCPFTFEYHKEALLRKDNNPRSEPCWMNIEYPGFGATIHLSFKPLTTDSISKVLEQYIEESRTLVYKHTVKASDILEDRIEDDSARVFGLIYRLEGNAASSMQFYITDSTRYFVRGALYFNVATNIDSLSPVIRYIQDDILHFVNTFGWKKNKPED